VERSIATSVRSQHLTRLKISEGAGFCWLNVEGGQRFTASLEPTAGVVKSTSNSIKQFQCLLRWPLPAVLSFFSLYPAVFADLDYARLKRSFEYFVEHYAPAELITLGSHAVKSDERSRMSRAHRALAVANRRRRR